MVVTIRRRPLSFIKWAFQSPTSRVNGCNTTFGELAGNIGQAFSPLQVGSMVVTFKLSNLCLFFRYFQSPTSRVNGCNDTPEAAFLYQMGLSVPYKSGQWL